MGLIDYIKSFKNILKEVNRIDQYKQITDLQEKIANFQNENLELEKENRRLKEFIKIKDDVFFENNACWVIKNGKKEGPYCSGCWNKEQKLINLHTIEANGHSRAYRVCPVCKRQAY